MKLYIKILGLFAIVFGFSQEGVAQSLPCFPNLPVTGAYATGGSSANKDRVFWLTWGSTLAESTSTHKYGHPNRALSVGAKSFGSIDLGGGRYMCIEAEILAPLIGSAGAFNSYIPGTYSDGPEIGDFLDLLYNIGGSGGTNGNPQNKMASGIRNTTPTGTANFRIRIKATTGGVPVRLRGVVVADAETLGSSNEFIRATGDGIWSVAEVKKKVGQGVYQIRKETNGDNTQSIIFDRGNDQRTGAVAFLTFRNTAYASLAQGYSVTLPIELKGAGNTAMAVGLLTSGYDFGDAPESYGAAIHLIDDIVLAPDGITSIAYNADRPVKDASKVDVNASTYNPGGLTYETRRYLGTTPPDADPVNMYSVDAKGDDNSGNAGSNEEDAWPDIYRQFADKEYKPGDKITAVIPYKKALKDDIISGWIDFNLNGTFDPSERIFATIPADGDGTVTLDWTVPTTRVAYSTYVRLRYFGRNQDATSPIGNALNGEVEDHRIYILTPAVSNPMLINKSKQQ